MNILKYCIAGYLLLFLLGACSAKNYKVKTIAINNVFEGQGAQGMAIYKDKAFLFSVTGLCRIFDLRKNKIISHFKLYSYHSNNHANNASFGIEFPDGNSEFPAIYISECEKPYRCFVENINMNSSSIIQTLQYQVDRKPQIIHDWIVDGEHKKLYAVTQWRVGGQNCKVMRFRLPLLEEKDIIFTENDVEDEFFISLQSILQGGVVRANKLYLPVGLPEKDRKVWGAVRALVVISLSKKEVIQTISLQKMTENEPEGISFWGKKLMIYCAPENIYQLTF